MIRKHAVPALVAAVALQASLAYGLGLGDITLRSSLNERLDADIRLRGVGDLNPAQILVRLGSGIDFDRAGVERLQYLSDLRFEVRLDGHGGGVVHVTTERPVNEPYLDFILEARWPNGRVLREYTVLLDLPVYTRGAPPSVAPPVQRREAVRSPGDDGGLAAGSGEYRIRSGDTLWRIASRARPAGVSVQQMMNAIVRDNPRAFVGGDMNRMLAGVVLRLPQGSDLDTLESMTPSASPSAAVPPAGEAAPSPTPSVEPDATTTATVDEDAADEAYLAITGDRDATAGDHAGGGDGAAVDGASQTGSSHDELAAAQESLLAAERANEELQTRVAALEAQVADFQKISELEQQQPTQQPAPPVAPEPGFLERMLQSTTTLVAIALALLAGMVAFLSRRRRTVSDFVPAPLGEPRVGKADVDHGIGVPRTSIAEAPVAAAPPPVAPAAAGVAAREEDERTDPITEADVCLAYGHTEKAEAILREALRSSGDDAELRLKLMEVLATRRDESEFLRQYGALAGNPAGRQAAREILEQQGLLNWIEEAPVPAREQALNLDLAAELQQVADTLGGNERPAAHEHGALLAKTEQAIARAAAELDFDAETLATTDIETDSFGTGSTDFDLSLDLDEAGLLDAGQTLDAPGAGTPADDVATGPSLDEDLAMLAGTDETATKLDLARAYIDMGDLEGARDILEEVRSEGNAEQQAEAEALLRQARALH